jgi:molybdenum cofactor cytidylyltransferase
LRRQVNVSAVVLAAGSSTRFGAPKLIQPLCGRPVLQYALDAVLASKAYEVLIVLGYASQKIASAVDFGRGRVLLNRSYRNGMATSLKLALRSISPDVSACVVVMGDQPLVTSGLIDRLIEVRVRKPVPAVVPVFGQTLGSPALLDRSLFPEVFELKGDVGAKSVILSHISEVVRVPVDDRRILLDIDTPEDFDQVKNLLQAEHRPAQDK